jgi:hypothetical protein
MPGLLSRHPERLQRQAALSCTRGYPRRYITMGLTTADLAVAAGARRAVALGDSAAGADAGRRRAHE